MVKFNMGYIVACEFLLGCLFVIGMAICIEQRVFDPGMVADFFTTAAVVFCCLAAWCISSDVGLLKLKRWAWWSSLLLGLFVLGSSGFGVWYSQQPNAWLEEKYLGASILLCGSSLGGVVMVVFRRPGGMC